MMRRIRYYGPIAVLLALLGIALAGCGGGGGSTNTTGPVVLNPGEHDAMRPTAIGGTVYTLDNGIINNGYNGTITLTGQKADGTPISPMTTRSAARGGYQFSGLPEGTYNLTAEIVSPRDSNTRLTCTVTGVHALGNIPNLMVNLLLGQQTVTFTGTVTENGQPAAGAVATVEVEAYTIDRLQDEMSTDVQSVILSTRTDANGVYHLTVPTGALTYYLVAHTDTSAVPDSVTINNNVDGVPPIPAGTYATPVDFALASADSTPIVFPSLGIDAVATTLAKPTATASQQAMVTRLAVARALRAPSAQITRLEKLAQARRTLRGAASMVENDLYFYDPSWFQPDGSLLLDLDPNLRGYKVYRSASAEGPYTQIGNNTDPFLLMFFDNDPALADFTPMYYRVTSYGPNGQVSGPSTLASLKPLPPMNVRTADGAALSSVDGRVEWDSVAGAKSYLVVIFNAEPSYNLLPARYSNPVHGMSDTSEAVFGLNPGRYWWSVVAYNSSDPTMATAASFSEYRTFTIN